MKPDIGLANWFAQRALRTPERKALHFEGRTWTYGQMQAAIADCAARLSALGVTKGERVAFLGHNQPMFLFAIKEGVGFAPVPGLGAGISSLQGILSDPGVSGRLNPLRVYWRRA